MISPSKRPYLPNYKVHGYATFLARPIRSSTLLRVLLLGQDVAPAKVKSKTPAKTSPGAKTAARSLHILLAEDNAINALLARTALTRAGHLRGKRNGWQDRRSDVDQRPAKKAIRRRAYGPAYARHGRNGRNRGG
jgi:hypothetical protein